MRSILIFRGGALGDFIVTLPALALLRDRWPAARIDLVGNATAARLGQNAGLLDGVESQHDAVWSALYSSASLPAALRTRLTGYDLILNYWPDPDRTLARHFPLRPDQRFLSAAALPTLAPAAAHYCQPLAALGLVPKSFHYSLVTHHPDPSLIALHPGSGSPNKNWPLPRWRELADWLIREHSLTPHIISGEAEPAEVLTLPGQHWHNLPLPDLLAHLSRCRLFIGHDSGISHLAAAAEVSSLLLFGPTDPRMWAPPHPSVHVIHAPDRLTTLSLPDVQQVTHRLLLPELAYRNAWAG